MQLCMHAQEEEKKKSKSGACAFKVPIGPDPKKEIPLLPDKGNLGGRPLGFLLLPGELGGSRQLRPASWGSSPGGSPRPPPHALGPGVGPELTAAGLRGQRGHRRLAHGSAPGRALDQAAAPRLRSSGRSLARSLALALAGASPRPGPARALSEPRRPAGRSPADACHASMQISRVRGHGEGGEGAKVGCTRGMR